MFKSIGRRLLGALSITGQFKKHEADEIAAKLDVVERSMAFARNAVEEKPVPAIERAPNRAERSQARRDQRHRVSRNVQFHRKRHNPYDHADGITFAQPRLTHATVNNKGTHWMYNPRLTGLLYASGALDATYSPRSEAAQFRDLLANTRGVA